MYCVTILSCQCRRISAETTRMRKWDTCRDPSTPRAIITVTSGHPEQWVQSTGNKKYKVGIVQNRLRLVRGERNLRTEIGIQQRPMSKEAATR